MPGLKFETCPTCGKSFAPSRQCHAYCSRRCKSAAAMRRYRLREAPKKPVEPGEGITASPRKGEGITASFATNFTEVLKGDDYPLECYPDGYPKLPECLRRTADQERFSDAA